jgi:phosphoribosylformylglycinamidine synthase
MYVDGHLPGKYGEIHKVSALETLQFSAISIVDDITRCVTLDSKMPGDMVYVLGTTRNELGGSEYYEHLGCQGANVPEVFPGDFARIYRALCRAVKADLVASAHGIYRGGLGVHLALVAMAGNHGMRVDLSKIPAKIPGEGRGRNDVVLFSESPGRFIVTVDPGKKDRFEKIFDKLPCACIGTVEETADLIIEGIDSGVILSAPVRDLKCSWKTPYGDLT